MSAVDLIMAELVTRLRGVENTDIEIGFLSSYQDVLSAGEQKLIVGVKSDGPFVGAYGGGSSTLSLYVAGLVGFNAVDTMSRLQNLLRLTRNALYPISDRHNKLNDLLIDKIKELEPTPLIGPSESQQNAYFVITLTLKYTEKNS